MTSLLTAKRFVLSTIIIVASSSAILPAAQALPEIDPSFNLLELRHREQDIRHGLVVLGIESTDATEADASYGSSTTCGASSEPAQTFSTDNSQEQLSPVERRRQSAAQRNK